MPLQELDIHRRLFLVGCSRSGTTLLQVLLAGHTRVFSIPETAFFIQSIGVRRRPLAWFGLTTGHARRALERVVREIGRQDLQAAIPNSTFFLKTAVNSFVDILDRLTLEHGGDIWLEKTPMHIRYIDFIEKYVPDVHFIHIIRDGRDVVASIFDRARNFPERFGEQRSLDFAVRRWNRSLEISAKYVGRFDHTIVLYEQLVEQTEGVLAHICDKIDIDYDPRMKEIPETAKRVVPPHREWLEGATTPPHSVASKFDRLFDSRARRLISDSLELQELERIQREVGL